MLERSESTTLRQLFFSRKKHHFKLGFGNLFISKTSYIILGTFSCAPSLFQTARKVTPRLTTPLTSLIQQQLVGGFNPSEKFARQIGSFPQVSG